MKITEAREIAHLVNEERWQGFQVKINAAFQRLHRSAEKGNKEDRKLAKILWDQVGARSVERQ